MRKPWRARNSLFWFTVAGFLLAGFGAAVAVCTIALSLVPRKPIYFGWIAAPTATPSPTPTPLDTTGWKTYLDDRSGFEVRYPPNHRLLTEGDGTVSIKNPSDDLTRIEISVRQDDDSGKCFTLDFFSPEKILAEKKIINGLTFSTSGYWPDHAMGGLRTINRRYALVRQASCYHLNTTVHWQDIAFSKGATTGEPATAEELQREQDWINGQTILNEGVISTFKFTQ